jgi:hypothetical protein
VSDEDIGQCGVRVGVADFVSTGCDRSSELASWDGIAVDFCLEDHLALLIDV